MTEDCPVLIVKMQEKRAQPKQPTQNLQMMRVEPCEEDPNVNIVLQSGMTTGEDKRSNLKKVNGSLNL